MLRTALLRSRSVASRSRAPRSAPQWLSRTGTYRTFADTKKPDTQPKASIQDSDAIVFPGSQSQTAKGPTPPAPGPIPPTSATAASQATTTSPATPSSDAVVPPQQVPLIPPQPPGGKVQTAPPTSIPSTAKRDDGTIAPKAPSDTDTSAPPSAPPPPPPPPPKPKPRRFRRFLITLILLGAFGFAGGTYYSLLSDNFHDFFTEYVPFGEDAVLYFEEREFRRRFPSMTNPTNRPSPPTNTVTIPSKSGLSWKVSEEDPKGSDLEKKGRHMSALDGNQPRPAKENAQRTPAVATGPERTQAVEQAKKDMPSSSKGSDTPTKTSEKQSAQSPAKAPEKAAPAPSPAPASASPPIQKAEAKSQDATSRPPEVNEPNRIMPTPRIDPLKIPNADEPVVQDLVKIINDLIVVVNADNAQTKYQSPINKAKSELAAVGGKILAMKQAEKNAAQDKIKATETEFENAAKELVRRLEEELRNQSASYRDEFEAERERVSKRYEERLENEIKRAQEVSDQRLRNELLEQAVSLKQKFGSEVQQQVETERSGRLSKLSSLSSSIEELESLTSSWNKVIDTNLQTQHLLLAVEAVRSTLENADRPRPFVTELATLKELATDDPVISSAIASINPTAYQRGVPTTSQLIDRFRRVASEVRKASLLPEDAGVASHAASYLLSRVMFKKQGMTMGDDVESVLTRTETLLEEGRLDEAAREINCLDGWAKSLSADWLGEVRKVLEVRQAVDVMGTQARLLGLGVE
ncbi:MICOS complex subunit mic60 [Xanthoria calcicola]